MGQLKICLIIDGATQYFSFNVEKIVGSTDKKFLLEQTAALEHSGQVRAVLEPEGSISADCSTAPYRRRGHR